MILKDLEPEREINKRNLLDRLLTDPEFKVDNSEATINRIRQDLQFLYFWHPFNYLLGYNDGKRLIRKATSDEILFGNQVLSILFLEQILKDNSKEISDELERFIITNQPSSNQTFKKLKASTLKIRRNLVTGIWKAKNLDDNSFLTNFGATPFTQIIKFGKVNIYGEPFGNEKEREILKSEYNLEIKKPRECSSFREIQRFGKTTTFVSQIAPEPIRERKWLFDIMKERNFIIDPSNNFQRKIIFETGSTFANKITNVKKEQEFKNQNETLTRVSFATATSIATSISNEVNKSTAFTGKSARTNKIHSESSVSEKSLSHVAITSTATTRASTNETSAEHTTSAVVGNDSRNQAFAIYGNRKIDFDLIRNYIGDLKGKIWFDPFSGWLTTPFLASLNEMKYYGNDTNPDIFKELDEWGKSTFEVLERYGKPKPEIRFKSSFEPPDKELIGKADLSFTSPPYYDVEKYSGFVEQLESLDIHSYKDFLAKFIKPIYKNTVLPVMKQGGIIIVQVERTESKKQMWKEFFIENFDELEFIGSKFSHGKKSHFVNNSFKTNQNNLIFRKK